MDHKVTLTREEAVLLTIAVVPCPMCDAPIGSLCTGARGTLWAIVHVARRGALREWKRGHKDEYSRLRLTLLLKRSNPIPYKGMEDRDRDREG